MFFKVSKEDAKYQTAFVTRKHLALPISISTLMSLFQSTIQEKKHAFKIFNNNNCEILNINPHLYQAFENKTRTEKIDYYAQCVEYLSSAMKLADHSQNKKQYLHPIVEANAYLKSKILGKWEKYTVKISLPNGKMVLIKNKTEIGITLDKYYLRGAKDSSKLSIVLETIVDNSAYPEIRIAFQQHFHVQLKKILQGLIWEAEKDRFDKILIQASGEIKSFIEQKTILVPSGFLTEKIIDRFEDSKKRILSNVCIFQPNKRFIMNKGSKRLYIAKDTYYFEEFFFLSKEELMKVLKFPTDIWNSLVKQFSIVETQQEKNLEVIYEKFRIKDKLYDNIFLREDVSIQTEGRILNHGLKNNYRVNQNTQPLDFDYSLTRVIPISETESKICIEIDMQFHHKQEHQLISTYFDQFSKIYQAHLNSMRQQKSVQKTIMSEVSFDSGNFRKPFEQVVVSLKPEPQDAIVIPKFKTKLSTPEKASSSLSYTNLQSVEKIPFVYLPITNNDYIKQVFELVPSINHERKLDKIHYLWKDWEKIQSGGIICVNDKIISEQKKIFKHIIASFGKNLFKSGGILNISLPIGIFKKQSHLNTIAKNFSYAPLLLEPRQIQTSLQRMKLATIFQITIGTVGISMEKPFNPVLGETYQGWIDGCPIYLEQVSHHPPRSAYVMYGRGYRIYGQIEPKVQLGMNSVKGYNERQNIIQFEDGSKISFSIPKMVIKGMLFGDRQFNFEDKNYIYDFQNHIFSQVTFGPRKGGGFFSKAEDPSDFLYGKIVKVTPNFYLNWKDKRKIYPQKNDIVQELSTFEGVWNESISFDGKNYFSFKNQLPCELDHQKFSLLSDSVHRRDLQKLIEGKIQEAQAEKQGLQEFQRKDRRLRESHHKK